MGKLRFADIQSALEECTRETVHVKNRRVKPVPPGKVLPQLRMTPEGVPVQIWARKVEPQAWQQASWFASLPFVHPKGLSLMPDVHAGRGVPVGSVLPTVGALVPSAVGVDIGCGMMACRLNAKAHDLPDNLREVRRVLEQRFGVNTFGQHHVVPQASLRNWEVLRPEWERRRAHSPMSTKANPEQQMGTLGTGNHFFELCVDESQSAWLLVHSGSRGSGALLGQQFIDQAQRRMQANGVKLKNGLGWIPEEDPLFQDYLDALDWAQRFALRNRQAMVELAMEALQPWFPFSLAITGEAINCHHNYVAKETHEGEELWITRKGAIRAGVGEWGIIPSHMGGETLIVTGKGHPQSWCSCAHGAGRAMTRAAAKDRFTVEDLRRTTAGVECRKDKSVIDEIPLAYKPFQQVMEDQRDLVDVKHRLKAILCIKEPS